MKTFNIVLWRWDEKVFEKEVQFPTEHEATAYSLGVMEALGNITGRTVTLIEE